MCDVCDVCPNVCIGLSCTSNKCTATSGESVTYRWSICRNSLSLMMLLSASESNSASKWTLFTRRGTLGFVLNLWVSILAIVFLGLLFIG